MKLASKYSDRRAVHRGLKIAWALLPLIVHPLCDAREISVRDYGARPNDGIDDTVQIQNALNAAKKTVGTTVRFETGVYDISSNETAATALLVHSAKGLYMEGTGTVFMSHNWKTCLLVENSRKVRISGIVFDWDPLPFVQVRTVSYAGGQTVLEVLAPTKMPAAVTPVTSVLQYNSQLGRPASAPCFDWYGTSPASLTPSTETRGILNLDLSGLPVGTSLIVRFRTYGANPIFLLNSDSVSIQHLTIFSAPGMGMVCNNCSDVVINDLNVDVPAGSGRWISTCADGLHFTSCRGRIEVTQSSMSRMGDDAINIGDIMFRAAPGSSSRSIQIQHGSGGQQMIAPLRSGDTLKFFRSSSSFIPEFEASVKNGSGTGLSTAIEVELDRDIPSWVLVEGIAYLANTKVAAKFEDLHIFKNRARGFWIQTSDALINRCHIEESSGPAIEIRCDVCKWWEGPGISSAVITDITIRDCNYGPAHSTAFINIYAQDASGALLDTAIHGSVSILRTVFLGSGTRVRASAVGDLTIQDSSFGIMAVPPISTASGVRTKVGGNTFTGNVQELAIDGQ